MNTSGQGHFHLDLFPTSMDDGIFDTAIAIVEDATFNRLQRLGITDPTVPVRDSLARKLPVSVLDTLGFFFAMFRTWSGTTSAFCY